MNKYTHFLSLYCCNEGKYVVGVDKLMKMKINKWKTGEKKSGKFEKN